MKQFAKIFCLSAVFLIFAGMTARADYREVDGKKVVCPEYIIEENFFTTYSLKSKPFQVSGWNVNSAAGDAISANPLKIVDASEALPIIMERPIPLQTDDVLTFETCFNMISPIDNTRFQFKYEDKLLFEIVYKNQSLVFHGADERILISELAGNIVLKADINLAEQTVNIYINGKYVLKDGIFEEKINQMDSFVILTGEKEKGCMQISPVLLYKGYFVNELFLPYAGGGLPYGWIEPGKENKLATEPIPNNKTIDGECVHLISKSPVSTTAVRKGFADFSGSTAVRCFMNFEDSEYGAGVKLLKNEKCVGSLVSDGKNFCWISGGKKTVIKPIRCDFWYDLKIVADNKSKKAKVYINLQEIDAELYLEDSINGVEFTSSLTGNKGAWLDDVTVFPVLPLPEDYVPKPQPQEKTDDYYVGLQSCNLYKEGSGLGWNYIKMAQEREPIIGYYDEGKSEVADWETKWLSEHGIDFQMYCWFRGGVKWGAIKRPLYSAALHEGFLNSEYKSNMKFAVMFENAASQVSSLNDFKTYVVPYWIEYYFSNPSYFVIDNKPVVAIYQIGQFASQIG